MRRIFKLNRLYNWEEVWNTIHHSLCPNEIKVIQYATMEQATESVVRQAKREIRKNIMRMYHKAVFESNLPKFRDDYKNCQKVFTLHENCTIYFGDPLSM